MEKIFSRSLKLLKLYLIHKKNDLVKVDTNLVGSIFKTLCKQKFIRCLPSANKGICASLMASYEEYFVLLLLAGNKNLAYKYLNTMVNYANKQMMTVFETNVKNHHM